MRARSAMARGYGRWPAPKPATSRQESCRSLQHVTQLELTRDQVLRYRRSAGALDEKLPWSRGSLRTVAWAGLQDSVPRGAQLAIHARIAGAGADAWADPSLV